MSAYPYTHDQLKLAAQKILTDDLPHEVWNTPEDRVVSMLNTIQVTAYCAGKREVQQGVISVLDLRHLLA